MSRKLKEPYQIVPLGSNWGIKLLTSERIIEKAQSREQANNRAKELMMKNNRPMVVARTRTGNMTTVAVNEQYLSNIERLP